MPQFTPNFVATRTRATLDTTARQFMESFCRVEALASLTATVNDGKAKGAAIAPRMSLRDLYVTLRRIKILSPDLSALTSEADPQSNNLNEPHNSSAIEPFIFAQEHFQEATNGGNIFSRKREAFVQADFLCLAGLLGNNCLERGKVGTGRDWIPDNPLHILSRFKGAPTEQPTNIKIDNQSQSDYREKPKITTTGSYKGDFVVLNEYVNKFLKNGLRTVYVPPRMPPVFNYYIIQNSTASTMVDDNLLKNSITYPRLMDFIMDPHAPGTVVENKIRQRKKNSAPDVSSEIQTIAMDMGGPETEPGGHGTTGNGRSRMGGRNLVNQASSNTGTSSLTTTSSTKKILTIRKRDEFPWEIIQKNPKTAEALLSIGTDHPLYRLLTRTRQARTNQAIYIPTDVDFGNVILKIIEKYGPELACSLYTIYDSEGFEAKFVAQTIALRFSSFVDPDPENKNHLELFPNLIAILVDFTDHKLANCLVLIAFHDLGIAENMAFALTSRRGQTYSTQQDGASLLASFIVGVLEKSNSVQTLVGYGCSVFQSRTSEVDTSSFNFDTLESLIFFSLRKNMYQSERKEMKSGVDETKVRQIITTGTSSDSIYFTEPFKFTPTSTLTQKYYAFDSNSNPFVYVPTGEVFTLPLAESSSWADMMNEGLFLMATITGTASLILI